MKSNDAFGNPRKFTEKIAMHTHKQMQETAEFDALMKDIHEKFYRDEHTSPKMKVSFSTSNNSSRSSLRHAHNDKNKHSYANILRTNVPGKPRIHRIIPGIINRRFELCNDKRTRSDQNLQESEDCKRNFRIILNKDVCESPRLNFSKNNTNHNIVNENLKWTCGFHLTRTIDLVSADIPQDYSHPRSLSASNLEDYSFYNQPFLNYSEAYNSYNYAWNPHHPISGCFHKSFHPKHYEPYLYENPTNQNYDFLKSQFYYGESSFERKPYGDYTHAEFKQDKIKSKNKFLDLKESFQDDGINAYSIISEVFPNEVVELNLERKT